MTCKYGHSCSKPIEKITDVYLSDEMIADAFTDKYDIALLITGDTDQVPTLETIKRHYPTKKIIAVFPPLRTNDKLGAISDRVIHITEPILKDSLLPLELKNEFGSIIQCPPQYT
jgi:uncharacterized LabA/DUF88 family protein